MKYISREVQIGNVGLGGTNPVRLQSMTNTPTGDIAASTAQVIRLIRSGAGLVRLTAQNVQEAESFQAIKAALKEQGYDIPLIADIHFNPRVALAAAAHADKVRLNPGNYTDRRRKDKIAFSAAAYQKELEHIRQRLQPLVAACQQHGTALRIGSNHGSLSQRIMSRYGDTPEGMAESAMEFLRLCHELSFHRIVVSMKSSNTQVMTEATLLTVQKMQSENLTFPVHLGVTEAGDGLEGRIKSALGIGGLLLMGVGDTIRVSLTEAPESELPAAKTIAAVAEKHKAFTEKLVIPAASEHGAVKHSLHGKPAPWVILQKDTAQEKNFTAPDFFYDEAESSLPFDAAWIKEKDVITTVDISGKEAAILDGSLQWQWDTCLWLSANEPQLPVILKKQSVEKDAETFAVTMATELSLFLYYHLIDGIWLENAALSHDMLSQISFAILQASGKRITKTEYIACPSCGRTQFNIEEALRAVKSRTANLKGLKIGVMGCIVNGPGEMADADYGYVGSGKGRVTLYKGNVVKRKNIPEDEALEALVSLIKSEGDWQEQ